MQSALCGVRLVAKGALELVAEGLPRLAYSSLQAAGRAVAAVEGGQHAQRAAAYRSLVQRLLTLDVRDGAAVQQLVGAVLETTGGGQQDGGGGS